PEEVDDLRAIERAIGKPLLRVTLPDFDYKATPAMKLEIPLKDRIAKIREHRAGERARAKAKQERRPTATAAAAPAAQTARPALSRPGRSDEAHGVSDNESARPRRRGRRGGGRGRPSGGGASTGRGPYSG